jgi:hypothetical protein
MNHKDLEFLSNVTRQILSESNGGTNFMDRWPYTSPYLQEEVVGEEREPGVKPYRPTRTQAEVRADEKKAAKKKAEAGKDKSGYGPEEKFKSDWKLAATPSSVDRKGRSVSQRMDAEKPYGKRMTGELAREYGSRHAAEVTRVVKGAGEPQAVTYPRKKSKPSREIVRKGKQEESFDLYDLILHHLMTEGFAETPEAAIAIMSNMSEAWVDNIVDFYIEG